MKSFRAKPVGWRYESYRHYLAAKGISTVRKKYQRKFSGLVKDFPGENPRITERFARFRQRDPNDFVKGSFRTKDLGGGKKIVVGKLKSSGKYQVQSVLFDRNFYWSVKRVLKKGKVHTTKSGGEVRQQAYRILRDIKRWSSRAEIAGSIRREQPNPVDIDIVVVPKDEGKIRDYIRKHATKIYADGSRKLSAKINGIKTDIVFAKRDEFGAALLTFTGPFGANIQKRALAKQKGWLLNEKGLFDERGRRLASTEREIYNRLGRSYRPPSLRGQPRDWR